MVERYGSAATAVRLLRDVESLLKHPSVAMELGRGGVNTSIALLAIQGVEAYLEGNRRRAAEDLTTAAEEILARMEQR
jgi:hypothetical protein